MPEKYVRFSAWNEVENDTFLRMACVVLLAGVTLVVFSFLGGDPYRFDQYDLPKDVA